MDRLHESTVDSPRHGTYRVLFHRVSRRCRGSHRVGYRRTPCSVPHQSVHEPALAVHGCHRSLLRRHGVSTSNSEVRLRCDVSVPSTEGPTLYISRSTSAASRRIEAQSIGAVVVHNSEQWNGCMYTMERSPSSGRRSLSTQSTRSLLASRVSRSCSWQSVEGDASRSWL